MSECQALSGVDPYDHFGLSYFFGPEHQTVKCFNAVQSFGINFMFRRYAKDLGLSLHDFDVLNIGVGSGQHWVVTDLTNWNMMVNMIDGSAIATYDTSDPARCDRLDWSRITDFDRSLAMLRAAATWYPEKHLGRPAQILGDAIDCPVSDGSFDIVLAALCDHIADHERFYQQALRVLKPGGIFIVTYPHRELMTAIRTKIYGIDPAFTQFNVAGRKFLIESLILLPKEVRNRLQVAGFEVMGFRTLYPYPRIPFIFRSISPTIEKARLIMGTSIEKTPILTWGVGRKPISH